MRLIYPLLFFLVVSVGGFSQHRFPIGDICFPPPLPPVYGVQPEEQPAPASRSGNNYAVPFDTVIYNPLLGNKGFDIVICIDGVINNQQIALADNYVDSLVRRLQTIPHYANRFKYFNIYRIAILSAEEGSAYGFANKPVVNNRYGSRFNAYNLPRLLLPENVDTLFADANRYVPGADLVLMLAFDKKYGGSGWNLYDGRKVASFSIDEEYGAGSYHLGDEVIIHEMQHVMPFGGRTYLGDEYEDAYACSIYDTLPLAYKNSPNYTNDTTGNRKWQHWIDKGIPGLGFWDSAGVCPGNYRPTYLCAMKQVHTIPASGGANKGMPPFCPVCQENSTAYFDSVINPVYFTSTSPAFFTGSYTYKVKVDTPLTNSFRQQWFFDDSLVATGVDSFTVDFNAVSKAANHTLKFVCTDIDPVIGDTTLRRPWTTLWNLLTYDPSVAIAENESSRQLLVFPNPATKQLQLAVTGFKPVKTGIYDLNGRLVNEYKFSTSLDISLLPAGMYFIEVQAPGFSARRSFVKE